MRDAAGITFVLSLLTPGVMAATTNGVRLACSWAGMPGFVYPAVSWSAVVLNGGLAAGIPAVWALRFGTPGRERAYLAIAGAVVSLSLYCRVAFVWELTP